MKTNLEISVTRGAEFVTEVNFRNILRDLSSKRWINAKEDHLPRPINNNGRVQMVSNAVITITS